MQLRHRLLLALVLAGALVGLGVAEEVTHDERWPYPSAEAIDAEGDRLVGQQVLVVGTVEAVDGDRATIRASHDRGDVALTVVSFESAANEGETVRPGGVVQVLGTLESDETVAAADVAVVSPTAEAESFKYGVSLVGVGLFLVVFVRSWRVNVRQRRVEVRGDG